jgi:predicted kinase
MECARLDAAWIGQQILEQYLRKSRDGASPELRAFYMTYRACVRAKVNLLRAEQLPEPRRAEALRQVARYLELADQLARPLGPPTVLVVRGPAGVGKTTLAGELAELIGMEHLQTDAIRREMFAAGREPFAYNEGPYSAENRNRVYQAMFERAARFVSAGLSVVLDGTFLTHDLQRRAASLAMDAGARPLLVNCTCPPQWAAERIEERRGQGGSFSEAQVATHRQQRQEEETPPADLPQCHVDTSYALSMMTRTVLDCLAREAAG